MKAVLTVTDGAQVDRHWWIEPDQALVIGRGEQAGAVLLDSEISRLHCRISRLGNDWFIQDNGSLNGTYVNGEKVETARLRPGDTIRLGRTTLRFAVEHPAAAPAEEVRATEPARCRRCGRPLPAGSPVCPVCDTRSVQGTVLSGAVAEEQLAAAPVSALARVVRVEEEETVRNFQRKHPLDTSHIVFAGWQKAWYALILLGLTAAVIHRPLHFFHLVHVFCLFYLVVIAYKLVTVSLSFLWRWEVRSKPADIEALADDDLPVYTVLVPLYRESGVAEKIVRYISELDYPKDKLDVKILLEPDDPQTLAAIERTGLPPFCEVIVCPDSQPKTKPKACNHGLARACGEFLVIYDAEDRPEPDQLKKAVLAFRRLDLRWEKRRWLRRINPFQRADRGRTVCLQAKLNYYNPRQNLLTRWFTIEYATWFHLFLPGLHALRAPIPLGGTSNHFRTGVLQDIGGWDPFNVTEDCDLGIRLHKLGYRTQVLDTTTWEEANSRLGNWVRQRSRWVKGYLQTHLTHMRHPLRTFIRLRPWGTFNFLSSVGGLSLMLLLNPIFWAAGALYLGLFAMDLHEHGYSVEGALGVEEALAAAADDVKVESTVRIPYNTRHAWTIVCGARPLALPDDATWQQKLWLTLKEDWNRSTKDILESHYHFWNVVSQLLFVCTVVLVLGNLFFVLMHVLACVRCRMYSMIPYALLTPFYWVLISLAAWKGFGQLFRRPFYWEKTLHGLDVQAGESR